MSGASATGRTSNAIYAASVERVAIVGSGGAGKTTFAAELGRRTGLPVTHLDHHFWKPDWTEMPRAEWRALQFEMVAEPRWILDGNYGGTMDIRLPVADTLFIFGVHRVRCLASVLRRTITNYGRSVQAEGCPERFDAAFLKYIWTYPHEARVRLDKHVMRHGRHLEITEFTTRKQAWDYLDTL